MIVAVSVGRSAPREVRERLAPDAEALLATSHPGIGELLVLSTCHRIELYATADGSDDAAIETLLGLLDVRDGERSDVSSFAGLEAVRHLFRVTAGLESLVVGEPQIQAQVRRALYESRNRHAAGPTLSTLVARALRTGRRARRETRLGAIGESIGTATARLLEQRLGPLDRQAGLVIGAGVAAEDAAIALRARGARLRIASRNAAHAQALAARLDAETGALEDLPKLLLDASFAVVAVAGGELLTDRHGSAAILVDLSMPHAVAPALRPVTVDELPPPERVAVSTGIAEATKLIDEDVEALARWADSRHETATAIRGLRSLADRVVREEVARAASGRNLDEATLTAVAERVANKLLHAPLSALRNADARTAAWLAELLGAQPLDLPGTHERKDDES